MSRNRIVIVILWSILLTTSSTLAQTDEDSDMITTDNVNQLAQIIQFGYGHVIDFVHSPDEKWLAVGSSTGIWIHDIENPDVLPRRLDGLVSYVPCVAFTQDSQYVIGAGELGHLAIWDVISGEQVQLLEGLTHTIFEIRVSPDGSQFATLSLDKTVRLWSQNSLKSLWEEDEWVSVYTLPHSQEIGSVVYHPNEPEIATVTADGYLYIWSSETGEMIHQIRVQGIRDVAYYANGTQMLVTTANGVATVWDTETYQPQQELFDLPDDRAMQIRIHPDETQALFMLENGRIVIYDFSTQTTSRVIDVGNRTISQALYSPDGDTFLTTTAFNGAIRVWDSETYELLDIWDNTYHINGFTFAPDGESLLMTLSDGHIQQIRLGSWDIIKKQSDTIFINNVNYELTLFNILYSGDERYWIGIRYGTFVMDIHDVDTWERVQQILRGNSFIPRPTQPEIILFPDEWWNIETDELLGNIEALEGAVFGDFEPSGQYLAFSTNENIINNPILILDMETQQVISQLDGHSGRIRAMRYSPTGEMIATGSTNGVIRVWDIETQNIIQTLYGHNASVNELAYHPQGELIASASEDNTIRLWNVETGDLQLTIPIQRLMGFQPFIGFSPDGRYLFVNDSGTIYIWGIPQD